MFSFHKPKVYRSSSGCCICKAKSSSSRFTDSIKYEDHLVPCFKLCEERKGEICNACVLLVKRYQKLPEGSKRNWRHVVDHRAGPGSKSLGRSKTRNKKRPKLKPDTRAASPGDDDEMSCDLMSVLSGPSSPVESLGSAQRRKLSRPQRRLSQPPPVSCIDPSVWSKQKVCCGEIWVGPGGLRIIDRSLLTHMCRGDCEASRRKNQPANEMTSSPEERVSSPVCEDRAPSPPRSDIATHGGSTPCTTISDSSSDSGYDESSNPSVVVAPAN